MLGMNCGKRMEKYVPDYVVFDLETTGVSAASDEIIEISGLKVVKGKVEEEFSTLVNPLRPIPYSASMVNGITDEMVAEAPTLEKVFPEFLEFAGNSVLIGHNIHTFDLKFLYRAAGCFYGKTLDNDYIDTLILAKICLPQLAHRRLTDLAAYYHISAEGAHRALNDCYMNQQVFEALGKEMQTGNLKIKICPRCGQMMQKRNGRYGEFWGCSGYPKCRYTENISYR